MTIDWQVLRCGLILAEIPLVVALIYVLFWMVYDP